MPIDKKFRIDPDVLLPIAIEWRRKLKTDPACWTDSEIEQIRAQCGPKWAHIPIDHIRHQLENMRRRAMLPRVGGNNHGKGKTPEPPKWYTEYLETPHWKKYAGTNKEFWDWKCALCYSPDNLQVHHRTYERLHEERLTDCITLCRRCHQAAGRAMAWQVKQEKIENPQLPLNGNE
jgi:5-methylcytosine-specific restriction endonuclease McrA